MLVIAGCHQPIQGSDSEESDSGGLFAVKIKTSDESKREEEDYLEWLKGQKDLVCNVIVILLATHPDGCTRLSRLLRFLGRGGRLDERCFQKKSDWSLSNFYPSRCTTKAARLVFLGLLLLRGMWRLK